MKKLIGGILLLLLGFTTSGQILNFEIGQVIPKFDYKNSNGESLDGLKSNNRGNIGFGIRHPLLNTNWHASLLANYNRYEAEGSDPILGNYYKWDARFIGLNLGIDYEFFRPEVNRNEQHGFSFYLRGVVSSEFLIDGTQNLNNQISDLNGTEEFDKPFYYLRGAIGVNYYISKTFILYGQYIGGRSFLVGNYDNKEQLRFTTHSISIGLAINLMYFN